MRKFPSYRIFIASYALIVITSKVAPSQCEEDLTLTLSEKLKLDEFRERVAPNLPHAYMKEEIYLIRWLRARNFNVDAAVRMLNINLKWRQTQQMDKISEEDWSEFHQRYRYHDHGFDKQDRPVAVLGLGSWDIRRAAITGESEKLSRYLDFATDSVCNKPRHIRAQNSTSTVTQVDFIVDLSGFSMTQQGCLPCVPFYVGFVANYENYHPNCADKILLLNTPAAFEIILTAVRPFFSQQTRDSLEVYGTNKNKWQPILFSRIEKSQLPFELGGTDFRYDQED